MNCRLAAKMQWDIFGVMQKSANIQETHPRRNVQVKLQVMLLKQSPVAATA